MADILYRVTKTPRVARSGWQYLRTRVRYYSNMNGPIQTFVYSLFDHPIVYDVKVEMVEIKVIGEIDMKSYMSRNDIASHLVKSGDGE